MVDAWLFTGNFGFFAIFRLKLHFIWRRHHFHVVTLRGWNPGDRVASVDANDLLAINHLVAA